MRKIIDFPVAEPQARTQWLLNIHAETGVVKVGYSYTPTCPWVTVVVADSPDIMLALMERTVDRLQRGGVEVQA